MKRMIAMLLAAVLLFSTAACGVQTPDTQPTNQTTRPTEPTKSAEPTEPTGTQPPRMVSVTLDTNDGSTQLTVLSLLENTCYGPLPELQREDYFFLGWFTDPEAGTPVTPETILVTREDHAIYAHWQPRMEYTVTFDPNGGTLPTEENTMTVTREQPYGQMPVPVLETYRFLGWYTALEGGELVDSTTIFNGKDHTLYARWEFDVVAYWDYFLRQRVSQIPEERRVVVYLERTANYTTFLNSDFLNDVGAINPAEGRKSESVTDKWIRSVDPYLIVKLTGDIYMGSVTKVAMQRRFSDIPVYIFPGSAVNGSQALQVYYRFQLAKLLYPEFFTDVDLKAMAKEFGISPRIY